MSRRPIAVVAAGLVFVACGPEPDPDWMLGVFSDVDGTPGGAPFVNDRGNWNQWTFRDDRVVEYASAHFGELQEPVLRTWDVVHDDRIVIFPADVEETYIGDSWWITRHGTCGPFGYQPLRDGEPETPEEGEIYPGEICATPEYCPDLGEDVVCQYRLDACPGSPPPCGDDE